MSVTLCANPFDISASYFYFQSVEEYLEKRSKQPTVEEFDIDFIDGDSLASELFQACYPASLGIGVYFELLDQIGDDEPLAASVCFVLKEGIASGDASSILTSARDEISLHEGSIQDYAYELFHELYVTKHTPEIFQNYFDYEAFGRDLEINGDAEEYRFCRQNYVVVRHN